MKTRRRGHDDDDEGDENENGGDGWCADFFLFFTHTPHSLTTRKTCRASFAFH